MTITSNDPLAIERAQEIDRLRVDLDREQKKRSALELALIHLREAVSLPRDFSQRDSQIETAWVEAGEALYGPMGEWVRRSELPGQEAESKIQAHEVQEAEMLFISNHLVLGETYQLDAGDLQKLGIAGRSW
jgi:hypothetical protein